MGGKARGEHKKGVEVNDRSRYKRRIYESDGGKTTNLGGVVEGETGKSGVGALLLLDDYFEGGAYSFGGTDEFTLEAPAAIFRLNNGYNILNQDKGMANAYANT